MVVTFTWQEVAQEAIADSVSVAPESASLQSLLLDANNWFTVLGSGVRIIITLLLAWLIIRIVDRATRKWIRYFDTLAEINPRRQRAYTISSLLRSAARYILWPLAIITVLGELSIDTSALLATAGIAGIALGFGAQTLVQDVIGGIFLLFDDTIHVGDLIRFGTDEGVVEHIGVRLIKVRKFNGELLMIPAGELRTFGNRSIDFVRAVVNVGLSYEQNLEDTLPVMQRIADEWAEEHKDILLEEKPQVQAITEMGESSVNARIVIMVVPGEQFEAERALRKRLKKEFDRLGIEIPFPRRTIYMKQEEAKT